LSFLDVGRSFGPSWGALLATALSRHEPSAAISVVVATAGTMLALNVLASGLEARVAVGRRFV
jgi:ABC-type dipeptide/oligopeptide/nickel transport system permease subunit